MGILGGTHTCRTCHRVKIPKNVTQCAGCRSNVRADTKSKTSPRRCGQPIAGSTSGCGGFVPAGGKCDRCGK